MNQRTFGKIGLVLAKLIEIAFWIAAAGMLIAVILVFLWQASLLPGAVVMTGGSENFTILDIDFGQITLQTLPMAIYLAAPFAAVVYAVYAMIFRWVWQILKQMKAGQDERFSEKNSPFQPGIARKMEQIGWCAIAVPLISLAGQAAAGLFFEDVCVSVSLIQIAMGILVLFLASIFRYGVSLQNEVDGLV